jgi:hypothetical protein
MSEIMVLDNSNVTMKYYPESKILHHEIHQFFFGQEFRNVMNKGVEVFQKYGARKWLSDDRKVSAWSQEDQEWGEKDWFPRVATMGWKYWAIVLPEKAVGQITMKNMVSKYSAKGVQTRAFSSSDEAKKWLESCP